jgi:hypothetical protein
LSKRRAWIDDWVVQEARRELRETKGPRHQHLAQQLRGNLLRSESLASFSHEPPDVTTAGLREFDDALASGIFLHPEILGRNNGVSVGTSPPWFLLMTVSTPLVNNQLSLSLGHYLLLCKAGQTPLLRVAGRA